MTGWLLIGKGKVYDQERWKALDATAKRGPDSPEKSQHFAFVFEAQTREEALRYGVAYAMSAGVHITQYQAAVPATKVFGNDYIFHYNKQVIMRPPIPVPQVEFDSQDDDSKES